MQNEELERIKGKLDELKKAGYLKSTRPHKGTAEKTLYDLLKNEIPPNGISVKIKHDYTPNYLTIFNATPEGKEKNQIARIRNKYGYAESFENKSKVFNASVQANASKFVNGKLFQLKVDYPTLKVYLKIIGKDLNAIDTKSYWTFDSLRKKLAKRNKYLVLVKAWEKQESKVSYYRYYDYNIYELVEFKDFLNLLESGIIRVTFRIQIYKKGSKVGQVNDLGTSFEIEELDLEKLYRKII